ncbi:uncharacterized protein LOC112341015 [Selaginella moellendorffii]|uniref:uncharacterized protein LOC112341015 n=1 Tax=Selaginella moellendorffii TaxID=88036 RepID=UPI000D1C71F6|nr:uncharacterized protein LOC112341015 [Selaginella moellendorffii]|eukprot:XP_024516134.1 uncharacterized protein LOC112341015 [Selaginella moellendorffii]
MELVASMVTEHDNLELQVFLSCSTRVLATIEVVSALYGLHTGRQRGSAWLFSCPPADQTFGASTERRPMVTVVSDKPDLTLSEASRSGFRLLAGYFKLIPKELVEAFPRAILNIHLMLLSAFGGKGFYGIKVHEAVGSRVSSATIHFVRMGAFSRSKKFLF